MALDGAVSLARAERKRLPASLAAELRRRIAQFSAIPEEDEALEVPESSCFSPQGVTNSDVDMAGSPEGVHCGLLTSWSSAVWAGRRGEVRAGC
jgi:hypothetical protein